MCLVAQTGLLPGWEGMFEYLSMSRGASLINALVMGFDASIFSQFTLQKHMADLSAMVTEQPKDLELFVAFRASIEALRPLCSEPQEAAYHGALLAAVNALETSSAQGESLLPLSRFQIHARAHVLRVGKRGESLSPSS